MRCVIVFLAEPAVVAACAYERGGLVAVEAGAHGEWVADFEMYRLQKVGQGSPLYSFLPEVG